MNNGTFIGTYRQYRQACLFKFSLAAYPEEFDFELIKKYGFYSPKNKKDNPNGVSRDHMYSVREGLANNVPPWILAHPANCRLMLYLDNVSKNFAAHSTFVKFAGTLADSYMQGAAR